MVFASVHGLLLCDKVFTTLNGPTPVTYIRANYNPVVRMVYVGILTKCDLLRRDGVRCSRNYCEDGSRALTLSEVETLADKNSYRCLTLASQVRPIF